MIGPVLVTGAGGFVGRHLLPELGTDAVAVRADVRDAAALAREVAAARPRAVVHLAAASSVRSSLAAPTEVWEVNVVGTANVLEAVRAGAPSARVVVVSSGEVYGQAEELPTPETAPLLPLSPYAASKAAAEVACEHAVRAEGLDVVVARSFPHIGPGQDERFAVGSWARQLVGIEEEGEGTLFVGDTSVERDLTDVRDVCRAYRLLLESEVPAGTYNVASGRGIRLERVVELLIELTRARVRVERDASRLRPSEVRVLAGDAARLRAATGWSPQIPLERSLADALEDARRAQIGQSVTS